MNPPLGVIGNFCALGAQYTVNAIAGAVPIVHSGAACCLRLYEGLSGANGCQGQSPMGGSATPNDNIHRHSLVRGSEEDLGRLIEGTLRAVPAELYVVLTGCNVEVVGDDVESVVRRFQAQGVPIVAVSTPGFKGDVQAGHEWVVQSILRKFVRGPRSQEPRLLNLWGVVPYWDPFWSGNLETLIALLEHLGFQVNRLFGFGSSVENWQRIPAAGLNLLVSPWSGLETMELLRRRFGTPFLHCPVPPVGARDTRLFLERIAPYAFLADKPLQTWIHNEESRCQYYLERVAHLFSHYDDSQPDGFCVVADASKVLSLSRFLSGELGLTPGPQFITAPIPERFQELWNQFAPTQARHPLTPILLRTNFQLEQELRSWGRRPFLLGNSEVRALAQQFCGAFLGVSAPLEDQLVMNHSYWGWNGGLRLAEDLYTTMMGGL
ncbi:MAG TPA: nitrogenase component 1 [Fibrobacteraceae bacterium]|nr:nitrogenase component 1 [Fibrobacteraceae bacterium]